ncbi:MAG TPA: cache domain-containing protein, partial [Beijerinckiaceae bacterium]
MGFDEADKTDGTQPRRAHRLRAYLALLVLALVLPGLLFTGYVLHRYAEAERARLEAQVSAQAHNVAAAVDRRLGGLLEALRVLAVTSDLSDDDLAAFHRRAVEAREIVGRNIVLRAESGQQLVNARVPWGAPLPVVRLDADRRALAERRPVVSNAFRSPVTQESMVAIIAPIFEDAAQNYLLSLSIDLADASSILADVVLPDGQVAAIIDGSGVIVARSREHARFVGRKAPRTGPEGLSAVEQGVDLEGRPALIAWSRTTLADWRVASSAPLSAIDAPVRRAWGALAAIGAVTLFLSMLLVWALSRRIAGPLSALAAAGLELGARRRAPHVHTPLREANAIGEAMRIAGERLSDYEARLEKALSVARMFSFEWSVGSDVISRSESASELLGAPAADVREGSRVAFRARVQPEDVER